MARKKPNIVLEQSLNIPIQETENDVYDRIYKLGATQAHKRYIDEILKKDLILCVGPAGSGKSSLATYVGVELVNLGLFEKLLLSRPTLESCGERLGFLPGSFTEKIDPYVRNIYDEIDFILGPEKAREFKKDKLEVCPLAFARGRTWRNRFIICDEFNNATEDQIMLAITRIGHGSKMVINGDPAQSDLPKHLQGALEDIATLIKSDHAVGYVRFDKSEIVRNPIIGRLLKLIEEGRKPRQIGEY